ncbi:MAG: hypothetical protein RLZZ25_1284 [Gemmatimonadota bacterium]|jgi:Starch-binding associating with outer membrane
MPTLLTFLTARRRSVRPSTLTGHPMHRIRALVIAGCLALTATACDDFLDVNENPNAPQTVSANLYLSPMLHWLVSSPQWDGRFVSRYTQMWTLPSGSTTPSTWDRHGYDPGSDNGGQQWRDVYWNHGQNLVDMMSKARAEERWDLLGVGYVLKAWGWQVLTDLHGEIIVKEAINSNTFTFNYDSQEYAYTEVKILLDSAIALLRRTDGAVNQAYMARTDFIYGGDRNKWRKFAFGLLALHLNHYSNKSTYKPADVMAAVDSSFASNADDALLLFPGTVNDDRNFFGPTRNNMASYRQTRFAMSLVDGTVFTGVVDPRRNRMFVPSPDSVYRGLDINTGVLPTATQVPLTIWRSTSQATAIGRPALYLFDDKSKFPAMTYAQLQFVKAEAAFKAGNRDVARAAYLNGIGAHIDFVNARNSEIGASVPTITSAERSAFLASPVIAPTAANLTLWQIMSQKYIAQWGWGFNEAWMDLRRYHYTDLDPTGTIQVFPGFATPTNLFADNSGKVVQRIRPRYNSEYVWNRPGLDAVGGLALDYHTKLLWITEK